MLFIGRAEIKSIPPPSHVSKYRPSNDEFVVSEFGRNNLYGDYPKHPGTSSNVDLEYDAYPPNYFRRPLPLLARQSKDNKIDENTIKFTVVSPNIKSHGGFTPNVKTLGTICPINNKHCTRPSATIRAKADYASYFQRPIIKRITTTTDDSNDAAQKAASARMVQMLLARSSKPGHYPIYANKNINYIKV